jgi:hypothetical protein
MVLHSVRIAEKLARRAILTLSTPYNMFKVHTVQYDSRLLRLFVEGGVQNVQVDSVLALWFSLFTH